MDPDVSTYRILVADDDTLFHQIVRDEATHLATSVSIEVEGAATVKAATNAVRESYFDLLVLDLHFKGSSLGGHEIYRVLDEWGCGLDVLIMSRLDFGDLGPQLKKLIALVGNAGGPNFLGFVDKQRRSELWDKLRKLYRQHTMTRFAVENLALPTAIIDRRRRQYSKDVTRGRHFALREDVREVEVEIERLLRSLYLEVPTAKRTSDVTVHIEPIDRRGLSAAIVVNAGVALSLADAEIDSPRHKTVLKIGPKVDILEEASRFQEFVRFGVELDQRVELLGLGQEDSLAGIVYSFAGGIHRQELRSLDETLRTDLAGEDSGISQKVLEQLFTSRNWYSTTAKRIRIDDYFTNTYRTDLRRSSQEGEKYLQTTLCSPEELGPEFVVTRHRSGLGGAPGFSVSCPTSPALDLPDSSLLGEGIMGEWTGACLVHGDLHGGNVMLEVASSRRSQRVSLRRVCLIDFRNAGPGPRCIDAVALESSIRLADSEAHCRQENEEGESAFTQEMRLRAAGEMMSRYETELRLYRSIFIGVGELPEDPWVVLASKVLLGARECFKDMDLQEYLQISLRYIIRHLGYGIPPVARTRILTWFSALYTLASELREQQPVSGRRA